MEKPIKTQKAAVKNEAVPLSDIFFMTLRHWPWIIVSVVVCVGIAYLYLLRTPDVYTESAEIQIKQDSEGQSASGATDFSSLGLFKSNTNIQNELTNLKAKDLMEEVVRRLNLDFEYARRGTFHDEVAYGPSLPVTVSVQDLDDSRQSTFDLSVSPDGSVRASDFREYDKPVSDKTYTGRMGVPFGTPLGKMTVTPTEAYKKGSEVSLKVTRTPVKSVVPAFLSRLNVALTNKEGSVVSLSMSDRSRRRADDVLNMLITVYNENWVRDKNRIAVSTSDFINERLGVIESELGNVDASISSYKSANLVPDVNAAASMYMSRSQSTEDRMLELNNELQMARYLRSCLTDEGTARQLLPSGPGIGSESVQSLADEYNALMLQRNALAEKSSDRNPLVREMDTQLAAQRQAIVRTVDNEIVALNTQLRALRGSEQQITSRIASNPTQAKNLLSVERQQKVKESLYLFLLQKREENELSQAFTAYNTKVVNRPGPAAVPPTPNRRNILAMAFLVGLVIPFGVTFVIETGNTRLRGRKDVEHLAVPFLGEIPQYAPAPKSKVLPGRRPKNADTGHKVLVRAGSRNIINEAFRVLRTNVEFMSHSTDGTGAGNVIAVTSFNPGSGKSFITVNLATSIALKGKRVLVVDGDMRHGTTSAYAGSPKTGLANYLGGSETDLRRLIVEDKDCHELSFLPVGTIPPNPTELLELPLFGEMITSLRSDYDYIIIDCPPIEVVADAQIIDRYADRTFFVIRAGLLERSMIPELDRLYEEKKYRNMAFILNGTSNDRGRYGYSHSYRYGYGYGYGYGYSYSSDSK